MVSYDVIVSPKAYSQLDDYLGYIRFTLLNPLAAKKVWTDALETLEELKRTAGSLRLCGNPKLKALGYHAISFHKHNYVMLYRIEASTVFVDAIFHQRQDYENTFTQDLETDPFFNPSNQAFIEKSIKELREGKGTPHELIEEDVIHKSEQNNIAVYPKATISELQKEVSKIKTDIKNGKQPVFDKPASLIDALEK